MFEFREVQSEREYKPLTINDTAPFTQAWFFGEWQETMGRKVRRFEIIKDFEAIGFFQIIKYHLIFSKNFLYIPHGPIIKENIGSDFLKIFSEKIGQIAKEENAIFVRFDFFPPSTLLRIDGERSRTIKKVPSYGYQSSYFQPKYEWVLTIDKPENELLGNMHPKNRYNIRLAENKGVAIKIIENDFEKYFGDFYKLLKKTARRNNFNLHPKSYYQNIFSAIGGSASGGKTYEENKNAFLIIAKYENKILLVNLIFLYGATAYFVFGGSSDEHKNLMFSHLAQWESIKEAKKRGFKIYNFGGVDESGSYETYGGISIFKKRFGGKIFEHSDSYDIVLKPFWYYLYNLRKWLLNQK